MNLFNLLFGRFSRRGRALSFYNLGLARAKRHDHQGAIEAYTETIGMAGVPADLKAMALFNRALVHVATGDDGKGAIDLDAVLAMNAALVNVNVKTMARQKLARMESRSTKSQAKRSV
jgi:hypothetical protein